MGEYINRASVVEKLTSSEKQRAMREMDGSEAYSFFITLLNSEPAADVVSRRAYDLICCERNIALEQLRQDYNGGHGEIKPAADTVIVVRCKDCVMHDNCFAEDNFKLAGIENPFCCVGIRRKADGAGGNEISRREVGHCSLDHL